MSSASGVAITRSSVSQKPRSSEVHGRERAANSVEVLGDGRAPISLGAQDVLDALAYGATPARASADPLHLGADFGGCVRGRGGKAGAPQHGQVLKVVTHISDLAVGESRASEDLFEPGDFVRRALNDRRDAELRGARGGRIRRTGGEQGNRQPGALRPDDR